MDKVTNLINKRDLKRHYLIYYLRVYNRSNGEVIGHLVDITARGVMILRDSPVEVGADFAMRIRWRNSNGKLQLADFDGVCRWCRPDVNPDFYGAGFAITPRDDGDSDIHLQAIQKLVDDLAMPDPGMSDFS